MTSPRSIRFDSDVLARLSTYARARPGTSASALTNRFVDEALRMAEHPGIIFRDGPAGRRAVLIGGPDVWEVVRAVKSVTRDLDPDVAADSGEVIRTVVDTSGVAAHLVQAAVDYWAHYPEEIDDWIEAADQAERAAFEQWQRKQRLFSS